MILGGFSSLKLFNGFTDGMCNRLPLNFTKERNDCNWDIGKNKYRESKGIEKLSPRGGIDAPPLGNGCNHSEKQKCQIKACKGRYNRRKCQM